jgi:hypothetical protein
MRQIVVRPCSRAIWIVALFSAAWVQVAFAQSAGDERDATRLSAPQFTASDELIFPADTDRWVLLGTNIGGDYSDAAFDPSHPGNIGVVQMEPSAYTYLLQNGEYADGTMFLLSFYETQAKPEPGLNGFVQGDLAAREIHVVDRVKYQDNRAFYMFGADGGGPSAMIPAGNECVQCHAEHGAFDSTFTQFYPTIRDIVSQSPQ